MENGYIRLYKYFTILLFYQINEMSFKNIKNTFYHLQTFE